MKFDSKSHMVQELLAGKRFKDNLGSVVYFDEKRSNPFMYNANEIFFLWALYNEDIWTEITPRHAHQDLIDSYKDGQAWQSNYGYGFKNITDQFGNWITPNWDGCNTYRLHPHNELIQKHHDGVKIQAYICGDWIEEPNPDWYEDTKYRTKPDTNTMYEWMFRPKLHQKWTIATLLMTEDDAEVHYVEYEYRKTGRSWEVEV
jgi:hypothetical protein